ncbi:DUF2946 family protein [Pseudoduganella lutea]|uniref:DUF2946 domain-containing protein n=1 Tax=Pseudoduganella lutea TaxID=321985 RepID=A0A4P6L4Z5_9BURK|nr:DUF2946 family protein [Pseudoduganella lutea]QBE65902.1 DUF2946 domain-containing protein [Pseudoduganella lutea]
MSNLRQWKRLVTWLAVAAMLAAALLPSISYALAANGAESRLMNTMLAGICAPSGMRYDAATITAVMATTIAGDDDKVPGKQAGHMDDCPWCRLASDLPALPAAGLAIAPQADAALLPPLFYHSPAPLFTWAAGKPRGPPLLA